MRLPGRLDRPGADVRFADSGGLGRSVVLTHGAGMDHTMFEEQHRALVADGFRVVSWDLRGHGDSRLSRGTRFRAADALEDMEALRADLDLGAPVWVGHSLGGNLAQEFVRSRPTQAAGLIVLDSTWNAGPLGLAGRAGLRLAAPALSLIAASRLPGLMARASAVTPGAIAATESLFARMPKGDFLDVWRATASLIRPEPGYRTPVPLHLIRGGRDRTGNIASAMPAWARAEGVEEVVVEGAGHILTWDAPARTTEAILAALRRWRAAPGPGHG